MDALKEYEIHNNRLTKLNEILINDEDI